MYKFLLVFVFLFILAHPVKAFDDAGSESDSYEGLSSYSDETIEKANEAFVLDEEHEFDKFIEPLEYAAQKRYRYALFQYALWVIEGDDYLLKSEDPLRDLYRACNYLLMAAYRDEESACAYIEDIENEAKKIDTKTKGIMATVRSAKHQERKKWLQGNYDNSLICIVMQQKL